MKGNIKKKVEGKNFGFIAPVEGGKDVFFHENSLVDVAFGALEEGAEVEFETEETPKGINAVNVKLV